MRGDLGLAVAPPPLRLGPALEAALNELGSAGARGGGRAERLVASLVAGGLLDRVLGGLGLERGAVAGALSAGDGGGGPPLARLLDEAERERALRDDAEVAPEHVLLALAQWPTGFAGPALRGIGLTRGRVAAVLGKGRPPPLSPRAGDDCPWYAPAPPFTTDVTLRAAEGRLDRVEGRDALLDQVVAVLSRRNKESVLLVGEPGVGKTALVDGLAQRIVAGAGAPGPRRLLSLDVGSLLSGTRLRGHLEERVEKLLWALAGPAQALLFIDDLQHLLASSEAAAALGSLLEQALRRGGLRLMAAITPRELRTGGRGGGLAGRLQPILVDEPDEPAARAMAGVHAAAIATHHGVLVEEAAVAAAVALTRRYVPAFSVVLLDEADKAHPAVLSALLPLLGEGRLTDGHGRLADAANALLLLTANPSSPCDEGAALDLALRARFRPELLDRLDAVLRFRPLTPPVLADVARLQIEEARARLAALGIAFAVDDAALAWLAARGSDGHGGARPMRRLIERAVLDPIADALLAEEIAAGDTVIATLGDDRVVVSRKS